MNTFTFVLGQPLDLSENRKNELSKIDSYPNPAQGIVNISFIALAANLSTATLINGLGQTIYSNILGPKAIANNLLSFNRILETCKKALTS